MLARTIKTKIARLEQKDKVLLDKIAGYRKVINLQLKIPVGHSKRAESIKRAATAMASITKLEKQRADLAQQVHHWKYYSSLEVLGRVKVINEKRW